MTTPLVKPELPPYAKYFLILSSIILTAYVVFISSSIINPLLAALIVAALLTPLCGQLEKMGFHRIIATFLTLFILLVFVLALTTILSSQLASITNDSPALQKRLDEVLTSWQRWTANLFGVSNQQMVNFLNSSVGTVMKNSTSFLTGLITITAGYITAFILFTMSLFFFIYYRSFFRSFLYKLFGEEKHSKVDRFLMKFQEAINKYIVGLSVVILVVATLNTIGLMAIGIGYPAFFGFLAAILLIIPYIGILIGSLIPAFYALATTNSFWYPVGVILIFSFVQFLEGNFITPNIIGSRVNINPFFAILGLFVGGLFLGPLGIVLAVPLLGIFKIICDDVPALKPVGYVIGNPPCNDVSQKSLIESFKKWWHKK